MKLHRYGPHFLLTDTTTALTFTAKPDGSGDEAAAEMLHDVWLYGLELDGAEWEATCDGVAGTVTHYRVTDDDAVPGGHGAEMFDTGDLLSFLVLADGVVLRVNAGYDTVSVEDQERTA